jgi:hypothetical protein
MTKVVVDQSGYEVRHEFICIKTGDTAGFDLLIFRINLVPPGRTRIYIYL